MVIGVPGAPEFGASPLMPGTMTPKLTPLLVTPPAAVTTTLPVVAPTGTVTAMTEEPQLVMVAGVPLNVTPPLPCEDPKLDPLMFNGAPGLPDVALRLLIDGAGVTVKVTPLLAWPLTVTTTFPVVAPGGTTAVMLVELQTVITAPFPLNLTVLPLGVEPKLVPATTTKEPTAPALGVRLLMVGAAIPITEPHNNKPAKNREVRRYRMLSPFYGTSNSTHDQTYLPLLILIASGRSGDNTKEVDSSVNDKIGIFVRNV
jgi:hypothetical protein